MSNTKTVRCEHKRCGLIAIGRAGHSITGWAVCSAHADDEIERGITVVRFKPAAKAPKEVIVILNMRQDGSYAHHVQGLIEGDVAHCDESSLTAADYAKIADAVEARVAEERAVKGWGAQIVRVSL